MGRFTGILGLLTMLALAYAFSTNRRAIRLKTVVWGLGLQFVFAVFVLRIEAGRHCFSESWRRGHQACSVMPMPDRTLCLVIWLNPARCWDYFAFGVLPTVIFIAAFFAVLYHFGIMQFIIKLVAPG